jgi:hypothetical protein
MKFSTLILICSISLCLAIEEPTYQVLQQLGNNMEIRKYGSTKWVSTKVDSTPNNVGTTNMFYSLFNYISGANSNKQKMDMTAPVLMQYTSKDNTKVNKNSPVSVSMNFYIPSKFKSNTPQPTANNVFLTDLPELTVAVARFGGFAKIDDFITKRDALISALGSNAQNYDSINLITAGFSSPYTLFFRRNEVWLLKIN